jgi:hypothetical protein
MIKEKNISLIYNKSLLNIIFFFYRDSFDYLELFNIYQKNTNVNNLHLNIKSIINLRFSVETILKSYLVYFKLIKLKELKNKYSHDINKIIITIKEELNFILNENEIKLLLKINKLPVKERYNIEIQLNIKDYDEDIIEIISTLKFKEDIVLIINKLQNYIDSRIVDIKNSILYEDNYDDFFDYFNNPNDYNLNDFYI